MLKFDVLLFIAIFNTGETLAFFFRCSVYFVTSLRVLLNIIFCHLQNVVFIFLLMLLSLQLILI